MKVAFFLMAALLTASGVEAAEPESVRDRVAQFLESNVIGRTQRSTATGTIKSDGQDYLVEFDATITWSNLQRTESGLVFDEQRDVKQSNTKIDAKGARIGDPIKSDRLVTQRYAVAERKTTNSLVGLTTVTQNTQEDSTGLGFVTMIEISADNKEIYVYQSMAGFAEKSLDGKNLYPVSIASSATISLNKEGHVQTDETIKFYKVDINKDFAREEINRFNISAIEINHKN
ncbi:MAG: hypothetical protein NTV34_17420 [Proteobacteria bacterium]|nr:hypothetical protein [Pseudomonadota bacterium]